MNNPLREKWDIFIIIFAVYNCIELPMEAAFTWRSSVGQTYISDYLNYFIDSFFFIDIILNFRTSFYPDRTGEEIIDKSTITISYLKGMFFWDLISTIPFDTVYIIFHKL